MVQFLLFNWQLTTRFRLVYGWHFLTFALAEVLAQRFFRGLFLAAVGAFLLFAAGRLAIGLEVFWAGIFGLQGADQASFKVQLQVPFNA